MVDSSAIGQSIAQQSIPFDILDVVLLDKLPKHEIFATGVIADSLHGINMTGSGKPLRWVACTGEIGDWSVYVRFADCSPRQVQEYGDKVISGASISKILKFTSGAWARYRM